nr:leucine-rich repeat protein [Tanacetum cinerariifolium]
MKSPQAVIYLSTSSPISFLIYGLVITCLTFATVSASYGSNETDYHALLSFKSTITHDPDKVLTSWNDSFHYCEWSGILCGKRHKRVTVLILESQGLEGSLSPHVGNLSFLRTLSIRNNSFQGAIPQELGRLSRLRHLYLNRNNFIGVIPANLSSCSNHEVLSLVRNKLGGSIPKEMILFSKLTSLEISKNKLTGGIPSFLGNITSMAVFSCVENPLGGNIPDTLGLWKTLTTFYSGGCNLYGSIPRSIFNLSLLVNLSFAENHLTGSLPSEIVYLEMANNKFSGKLTIDFSKLRDIDTIRLQYNNFHGREEADDMSLSGSIPLDIKDLKMLSYLDLSYNNLSGTITSSLGNENERFLKVSYNQLLKATDGFSKTNLIGEGGFSSVYKGILDSNNDKFVAGGLSSVYKGILDSNDDKFVAVKVLHLQTRGAHKSFLAECEAWRNIRHRNLLKIITSYSSVDFQRKDFKALVYVFMPKGSVHDWLHSSTNTSKLNILQRINIPIYVAAALDYLHIRCQTTIVHGDLKLSNIILDDDMVAHVGDFGLTRVLGTDLIQNNSIGVKGTIRYAPPEYGMGSEMTSSGDVYSFEILLLELLTGKKPTDDMFNEGLSIRKFASMALPDHVVDVIDGNASVLQSKEANTKKVEECLAATIKIGVSCSVDSPPQRMKIDIVVNELQSILNVLQNI